MRFADLNYGDSFIANASVWIKSSSLTGVYNAVALDFNIPRRTAFPLMQEVEPVDAVYGYREQGRNWQFYSKDGPIEPPNFPVELGTLSMGDFFSYDGNSYMICKPAASNEFEVINITNLIYGYYNKSILVIREPKP